MTDGGAEENLGLISALYALESGLAKLLNGVRLRPIHVVIPEASGVSYDYSQHRCRSLDVQRCRSKWEIEAGQIRQAVD